MIFPYCNQTETSDENVLHSSRFQNPFVEFRDLPSTAVLQMLNVVHEILQYSECFQSPKPMLKLSSAP